LKEVNTASFILFKPHNGASVRLGQEVPKQFFICILKYERKYKFGDNDKLYFVSYAVVYWIDVFIRKEYREIVIESCRYCQQHTGLEIYGWVIMPSHVHLIIGSNKENLDGIVRDMKSQTSTQLRKCITGYAGESRKEWMLWMMERAGRKNSNNDNWQFWQQHNKPIMLLNRENISTKTCLYS
jgi:putative transposase